MHYTVSIKEDCIGEYSVYTYTLEEPASENLCNRLQVFGNLRIFRDFPRPYFSIKSKPVLIKGIIGELSLEITFFEYGSTSLQQQFEEELMCHNKEE